MIQKMIRIQEKSLDRSRKQGDYSPKEACVVSKPVGLGAYLRS